jgi:hypothetical protein
VTAHEDDHHEVDAATAETPYKDVPRVDPDVARRVLGRPPEWAQEAPTQEELYRRRTKVITELSREYDDTDEGTT